MAAAQEAGRLHRRDQLIGIAVHDDRIERRTQRLPLAGRPALHEAVVEERDAAVVVELVVARVRVAVEHPAPQHGVLGEPPQDFGGALLRGVGLRRAELLERHAVDPLGGEQTFGRQLRDETRDADPRVAGVQLGELDDVACLELVVELLAHARPQLVDERLGVEALQHHRREHRVHHLGGVEIGLDRGADAGVLHLDRDVEAARRDRSMDLADARRGDREVGPVEEDPLRWVAELGRHDTGRERRCHRRGVGLQGGEGGLGLLRQRLEDEADQLAGLHQHALHLAELLGDVLGGADRELLVELGASLGRGTHPACLADGEAGRVARRQLPHPGGAAEAAREWRPRGDIARLGDGRQPSRHGDDRRQRSELQLLHRRLTTVASRSSRGATGDGVALEDIVGDRATVDLVGPIRALVEPFQRDLDTVQVALDVVKVELVGLVELVGRRWIGGGGGDVHARRRYRAAPRRSALAALRRSARRRSMCVVT